MCKYKTQNERTISKSFSLSILPQSFFFLSSCHYYSGSECVFLFFIFFPILCCFRFFFFPRCFVFVSSNAALIIICFVLSVALYYYSASPFDSTISPFCSSTSMLVLLVWSQRFNRIDWHFLLYLTASMLTKSKQKWVAKSAKRMCGCSKKRCESEWEKRRVFRLTIITVSALIFMWHWYIFNLVFFSTIASFEFTSRARPLCQNNQRRVSRTLFRFHQ